MKYRVVVRKDLRNSQVAGRFYANPVNEGSVTIREVARRMIVGRSLLPFTKADVQNILDDYLNELPILLKLGFSVQLGNLGTLRLNLQSQGADSAEEFTVELITGIKVLFLPSDKLKEALKDVKLERE